MDRIDRNVSRGVKSGKLGGKKKMLMSVADAAKELGLSLKTARTRIQNGEWPVYRFSSKATSVDIKEIKKIYNHKKADEKKQPKKRQEKRRPPPQTGADEERNRSK